MEQNSNNSATKPKKPYNNKPKSNGNKKRNNRPNISYNISQDMKLSIIANKKSQDSRMTPWRKIDSRNNSKVRFTPLGGLGEIGGNMGVFETVDTAIIIDVGMSFPDETMHGVDILVPDFSYIQTIKHKIKGIIITHAHEDHIGAIPYLFKKMKFPIYATPIALAMIENKFMEHGLKDDRRFFNFVTKRETYKIGDFKVEWIHATHSIIDACSLAIETPAGIIIHTADFKIDHTPIDGYTMDLNRFAYYGDKGVLCLFSDSTNSHNKGYTKSEAVVGKTFDLLFDKAKGRLLMSTFSSNIHRIYQAMERGVALGRKICIIGRSMERNIEITRALGYIDIADKHFIDAHEVNRYKDSEILIITTGSQGESMAALSRMATNEHRHIKLKPTDTVIISASAIPGNEASVSRLMNLLMKSGVTVRYKEFENIHVSGHAGVEEQKLILRLVQPKFFLPIHGEYNHISRHAQTAVECGVSKRNILLMSDGDQVEISTKYLKKVKSVKTGKTYIDNQNNKTIENGVIIDRQKLASDGIVNIVAQISQANQTIVGEIVVTSFGLVPDKDNKKFSKEIEQILIQLLKNEKSETLKSHTILENDIRIATKRHILRTKKRYPLIIPTIFIV
jgi:ribonuclease J